MKKLVKKSKGGPIDPKGLSVAKADSAFAANYKSSPSYKKSSDTEKKIVDLKLKSPAAARAGKKSVYGTTPTSVIPLGKKVAPATKSKMKKGGATKKKC
jgi:hypothetical protein